MAALMEDELEDLQQPSLPPFMAISPSDAQHAASMIQQLYSPHSTPELQQTLQKELFELQKRPEAWGLVVSFIDFPDPQVQFFGAHTAQVKIARDWDQYPSNHVQALRDMLLSLTARAAATGASRVVLRKLYVSLSSLALRISPLRNSLWPTWIQDTATLLLQPGIPEECAPEFLAIAVEEVRSADLIGENKMRMQAAVRETLPFVMELFKSRLSPELVASLGVQPTEAGRKAWLKAVEAWIGWGLPADELTSLIPLLIQLLHQEEAFISASDVLQEVLTKSSMADGKGTQILTIPLLSWVETQGSLILQESLNTGSADEMSHSFCKLLLALGEHSATYIATNILEPQVQTFLRVLLGYSGFPGWYGIDEDESEMTLPFWYLLEEAILESDYTADSDESRWHTAKLVFAEAVATLARKVRWPTVEEGYSQWTKDQLDKFHAYRRDIGDTLVNAFYILRDQFFEPFIPRLQELLSGPDTTGVWENVESILFCIKSVQEAVPLTSNKYLSQVFGPEILGRLPAQGSSQVRRTALDLIGAYSTWFVGNDDTQLLGVMGFIVQAFSEPNLSLPAARALRDICEHNRIALSKHIGSFGQLHASLPSIPDTEKTKVIQAICSVIQALPPKEALAPVEAIVTPILDKLDQALSNVTQLPEQARLVCISQLQALSGCAKGLTNNVDALFDFDAETSGPTEEEKLEILNQARQEPVITNIRDRIVQQIGKALEIWSTDAETSEALSDLIKAITALPADSTLLSLPPAPVLELVCEAARRQITAVWLNLAMMLVAQLDPPSFVTLKAIPKEEATQIVDSATRILVETTLSVLAAPGVMEANPDIVRAFFVYLMAVADHFIACLVNAPQPLRDGMVQCAIKGLSLPDRYSLVDAAKFLHTFARRGTSHPTHTTVTLAIFQQHGRQVLEAILVGVAGSAPRSTIANLVELMTLLVNKVPEARGWMQEILYSPNFEHPKLTPQVKDKFLKVATSSRYSRTTAIAANEFALVARGLEGSSFGYASATTL
ncbi:hypothetical protein FRC03_007658 [Tulasnella sp. 419]|nr:hypothetical protein FRC03_007658 [Tulasnella sp. 419]